jgi:AGZA family xanthine/uracil permease-like MFS transporter
MSDTTARPVGLLDRYFGLSLSGTSLRTEFIAGATTFLTMVYIVFVNPQILGKAGMDPGAVFVATCIASAVSTLVMALYANYPIALATGIGLGFITYALAKIISGKFAEAKPAVVVLAILFGVKFAIAG